MNVDGLLAIARRRSNTAVIDGPEMTTTGEAKPRVAPRAGHGPPRDVMTTRDAAKFTAAVALLEILSDVLTLRTAATALLDWLKDRAELTERLGKLRYDGTLDQMLEAWAAIENLAQRVDGVERFDPVVLELLRAR